jgi:hypothetical protein
MSNGLQALQLSAGLDQQHLMKVLSVVNSVSQDGLPPVSTTKKCARIPNCYHEHFRGDLILGGCQHQAA